MSLPWIGEPLQRVDGHAKVTGQAKYSAEVPVSGVVYGVIVSSGPARGRITDLDTTQAMQQPGVLAVLTHLNAMKLPGGLKVEPGDRVVQALQDDRVVYSNQPIALALADSLERAEHAALSVRALIGVEPHTVRMDDVLHEAFPVPLTSASGVQPADSTRGDPQKALEAADARVDGSYDTPSEVHSPMEPHSTTAVWSGPNHLTVYDASQGIFGVRKKLATAFKLPLENVRVLTKFVGGGFGCKGSAWSHVMLAALAAKQLGQPVKVVLTRAQMFGMVGMRPVVRQQVSVGASADGVLTALKHDSVSTTSRFDTFLEAAAGFSRHMYACPNVATTHRVVRLDIGTPTYTRAPGESTGSFALESALDELAHQLKMDPLELRLRNEPKVDPDDGKPFSSRSLQRCYAVAAERFGWAESRMRPTQRGHLRVGVGLATASYPANYSPAKAVAKLSPDGSLKVESGAVDIGGGTYTVMAQVAAQTLGLNVSRVTFDLGDTQQPEAPRSGGSQTAASVASAVLVTCQKLRERLVSLAVNHAQSPLFQADAKDVRIEDGRMFAGSRAASVEEVLKRTGGEGLEEHGEVKVEADRKKYSTHSFGAQLAEVEVDDLLGTVRVTRMVGAFAVGRVLNARLARSQLMGGMVWGISMALHEDAVYDETLGRIMTHDLSDYHVPTHADVPDVEPLLVEEQDTHVDPAGVKGMGEIGITGAAAAIANAVFHATGRRIRRLPIRVEQLI